MKFLPLFPLLLGAFLIVACQPIQSNNTLTPLPPSPKPSATPIEWMQEDTTDPAQTPEVTDTFIPAPGDSFSPEISSDGRYVVFVSRAGDLVDGDINQCQNIEEPPYNCSNIFVYDHQKSTLRLVSVAPNGQPANGNSFSPVISGDGHWIAFVSAATNLTKKRIGSLGLFLYDVQSEHLKLIAPSARDPSISADGRFMAYNTIGAVSNVYLYDLHADQSEQISKGWEGQAANGNSLAPEISGDGRWLAFWSWAGNLTSDDSEICRENETVNYSCGDVFIFDRETSQMERIEVGEGYGLGMGTYSLSLSADGNLLAFNCQVFDRELAEVIYKDSCGKLSADGQFIAFQRGVDFFVRELSTGLDTLVSVTSDGTPGNGEWVDFEIAFEGEGFKPGFDMSEDARWVTFASTASNLAPEDNRICEDAFFAPHNCYDIFLHDRATRLTRWISKPIGGQ